LLKGRDEAADLGRLVRLLGELGDDARDVVYAVRRAWFVLTSPESGLELLGEERRLHRLPGEGVEAYRARLLKAFETWQAGGTDAGIEAALALVGLPDADVEQVLFSTPWRFDSSVRFDGTATFAGQPHWAWFDVSAEMPGSGVATETMDAWLGAIARWKAAHARLRRLSLDNGGHIADDWPLPVDDLAPAVVHYGMTDPWPMGTGVRFDGTHSYDGTWAFGVAMDSLELAEA
jgi:hypothetical protein